MDRLEALLNLKKLLRSQGITQDRVGERLGVHRTVVSKWLTGKRSIKVDYLETICKMVGTSIPSLFLGDDTAAKIYRLAEKMNEEDQSAVLRLLSRSELPKAKNI